MMYAHTEGVPMVYRDPFVLAGFVLIRRMGVKTPHCDRVLVVQPLDARGALLMRMGRALRTLQVVHKRGRFRVGR